MWHGLYIYALQTETVNNILTLAQSSQLYLCVCNIHTQSELDQTRTCWKNVLVNLTLLLWPRSNMLVKQHCPSPRSVYTAGVCVSVCVHVHTCACTSCTSSVVLICTLCVICLLNCGWQSLSWCTYRMRVMFLQCSELPGRCFRNFHYYYYQGQQKMYENVNSLEVTIMQSFTVPKCSR